MSHVPLLPAGMQSMALPNYTKPSDIWGVWGASHAGNSAKDDASSLLNSSTLSCSAGAVSKILLCRIYPTTCASGFWQAPACLLPSTCTMWGTHLSIHPASSSAVPCPCCSPSPRSYCSCMDITYAWRQLTSWPGCDLLTRSHTPHITRTSARASPSAWAPPTPGVASVSTLPRGSSAPRRCQAHRYVGKVVCGL